MPEPPSEQFHKLERDVRQRFGVVPNFFRLVSTEPAMTTALWGFTQFAYLDNPLPSLFKERLFVYLSRFCDVRYCIARHLGFLVGLGYPAGDTSCLPQTVEETLPLLRYPLPHGEGLLPIYAACAGLENPLTQFPVCDSKNEQALIACATHVSLQTRDAVGAHEALRLALGPRNIEYLNLFLAFVRTAHYWTKLHPELAFEHDITDLLATHEALAQCILNDPAAMQSAGLTHRIALDLTALGT
jgi:hypothetical protein